MKKTKSSLSRNDVQSETLHVGIELELIAPSNGHREHDDDRCNDDRREYLRDLGPHEFIDYVLGVEVTRDQANALIEHIDREAAIDRDMEVFECENDGCSHWGGDDEDSTRDCLEDQLKHEVKNSSIKVVSDGSIEKDDNETDAEVCWNYFASKETVKDNSKILAILKDKGLRFNTSCGLHINLNNYLNIPRFEISVTQLEFLYSFVAASRKKSQYCNRAGISSVEKYSMIYHQQDRLEFRFFSPTLEPEKLNFYVHLANVVYKRLAGKDAKLSLKAQKYFLRKMIEVNGLTELAAQYAIDQVNSLDSIRSLAHLSKKSIEAETSSEVEVA